MRHSAALRKSKSYSNLASLYFNLSIIETHFELCFCESLEIDVFNRSPLGILDNEHPSATNDQQVTNGHLPKRYYLEPLNTQDSDSNWFKRIHIRIELIF